MRIHLLRLRRVSIVTAVVIGAVLIVAAPEAARADSEAVLFSADGIHWAAGYSGQLFAGALIVPGGAVTRSFFVRNAAAQPGALRVTLADVSTDDLALADAISITSSTDARSGAPVPLTMARPCATLAQGQIVDSGAATRVDAAVAVSALDGSAGQSGWVSFVLRVTFSSTDAAAPAPADCPSDGGTVDGLPAPTVSSTGSAPTGPTTGSPVYHRVADGWRSSTESASEPVAPTPAPAGAQLTRPMPILVANTERFFQEYTVEFWIAMWLLGTVVFLLARRRRAPRDTPEMQDQQIGLDR